MNNNALIGKEVSTKNNRSQKAGEVCHPMSSHSCLSKGHVSCSCASCLSMKLFGTACTNVV